MSTKAPHPTANDSDDDDFEDAQEGSAVVDPRFNDVSAMLADATKGMDLYINNHFDEAKALFLKHSDVSIYHALGHGTLMFIQAILTFDPEDIEQAMQAVRKSTKVCNKRRRKQENIVTSMMTKKSKNYYNEYTPVELHAELCYAECLVERALLTFLQDETLKGFVEGALKVKACYDSYKLCLKIYKKRKWEDIAPGTPGCDEREQFGCGITLGVGVFTLLIASLPAKILKLLEYIGFSGDKASGLYELEAGASRTNTVHGPLAALALVAYHTIITHWFGTGEGDVDASGRLLKSLAHRYKQGAIFLFLEGRQEVVLGHLDEGIMKYEESIASQSQWKQFHHLCYWELMWCHAYTGDWVMAMKYAERMYEESNWSRSVCAYLKACFLMMVENPTAETHSHIAELLKEVPKQKQVRAGKSIPVEKFTIKKADRYFEQKGRLTLAAFEIMYLWTGCCIFGKKKELAESVITIATKCAEDLSKTKASHPHFQDDLALATFIKGVALRFRGDEAKAQAALDEVMAMEKGLVEDKYLLPCALYEQALLNIDANRVDKAKKLLETAKSKYTGYSLESRVNFRLNAAEARLKPPTGKPVSSVFDPAPPKKK